MLTTAQSLFVQGFQNLESALHWGSLCVNLWVSLADQIVPPWSISGPENNILGRLYLLLSYLNGVQEYTAHMWLLTSGHRLGTLHQACVLYNMWIGHWHPGWKPGSESNLFDNGRRRCTFASYKLLNRAADLPLCHLAANDLETLSGGKKDFMASFLCINFQTFMKIALFNNHFFQKPIHWTRQKLAMLCRWLQIGFCLTAKKKRGFLSANGLEEME